MTQEVQELSREELKILHYRQKVAELQEENADLRVELHIASVERDQLKQAGAVAEDVPEEED